MISNRAHFVAFSPSSDKMVLPSRGIPAAGGDGRTAWASHGAVTSGLGPLLIMAITVTAGWSRFHPPSPCADDKETSQWVAALAPSLLNWLDHYYLFYFMFFSTGWGGCWEDGAKKILLRECKVPAPANPGSWHFQELRKPMQVTVPVSIRPRIYCFHGHSFIKNMFFNIS